MTGNIINVKVPSEGFEAKLHRYGAVRVARMNFNRSCRDIRSCFATDTVSRNAKFRVSTNESTRRHCKLEFGGNFGRAEKVLGAAMSRFQAGVKGFTT